MNGAQYIVEDLIRRGVDTLFGYPGGCIMPLYDAMIGSSIRHILCRHEQGAAFAANGYARSSGRTGVCLATSGPGATNLITGIADAYMDSIPMVAITGQVPLSLIGTDAFQEIDILGLSLPITKHSFLVESIDQLPRIMDEAFELAASGRPGPVLIDLPKDVQLQQMPEEIRSSDQTTEETLGVALDDESIAIARDLIQASARPMIYAGGGISLASAVSEFRHFVETSGIPTVLTLKGLGNLPADDALNMGMLGMHGSAAANLAVQECDLLIAIGARFDDRVTGKLERFAPDAKVIHIDADAAEVGKLRTVACSITSDLAQTLNALNQPKETEQWRTRCEELSHNEGFKGNDHPLSPAGFISTLADRVDEDAVICCDVGQHQMWVAQHYPVQHPRNHLSSGGLGAMGFGLPAAIGAQLSRPDATVINIAGDGSFMMNPQELATLQRYRIPVKIIVLDNSGLGMVRQQQEVCYDGRYTEVDLTDNPDFSAIARAFGIEAETVTDPSQVQDAIDRLVATPGPALLHVPIASEENVWPMVKPGDANEEMLKGAAA
jgi:acetolactate synthase-1/2/3 large subunit